MVLIQNILKVPIFEPILFVSIQILDVIVYIICYCIIYYIISMMTRRITVELTLLNIIKHNSVQNRTSNIKLSMQRMPFLETIYYFTLYWCSWTLRRTSSFFESWRDSFIMRYYYMTCTRLCTMYIVYGAMEEFSEGSRRFGS